jgi:hypothetical protein
MRIADTRKKKNVVCILVTIDIKNAFNSIKWLNILNEVKERKVPDKLMILLRNYSFGRKIIVANSFGTVERYVYMGVPQELVLGPFLCNLVYDGC